MSCIDTSPFGFLDSWSRPPTSGLVDGGKLYGCGAADSKLAAAIFAHILHELAAKPMGLRGSLYCLFDADEHTGQFGGIRAFLESVKPHPEAALIGYPGNYGVVIGARGFFRVTIHVYGIAAHSGSKARKGMSAIRKMATLIQALEEAQFPEEQDPLFSFGPTLSVTEVGGGHGFSQIADHCWCKVDVRLTPSFSKKDALVLLEKTMGAVDKALKSPRRSAIEEHDSWSAYRLDTSEPIVQTFVGAAKRGLKREVRTVVCGPSNVGNLLSASGIPAICGFGVDYENIHAANEHADLKLLPEVYGIYLDAVTEFLS